MSILDKFKSRAKVKEANIGIGLGLSELQNNKILKAVIKFISENKSKIFFFGMKDSILEIKKNQIYNKYSSGISLIESKEPENEIIDYLINDKLKAGVRGSLDSHKFLDSLKKELKVSEIYRLALLETYNNIQFFFGPVGIDESNSLKAKINFIKKAINEISSLEIRPKISILSGGRKGDIGRSQTVDRTIQVANEVVRLIQQEYKDVDITHDEILIENAIEKGSNLIIAPDGISGNLIYRTLVHLGRGKAYGAIYMGLNKTIIDTSRVGDISEIHGALLLALALSK
ncbi:MAG: methanogenesis marker protein Mmp4/MtxX [Promethearchaeota archaeon]